MQHWEVEEVEWGFPLVGRLLKGATVLFGWYLQDRQLFPTIVLVQVQRIDPDQIGTVLRALDYMLNICKGPTEKAMYGPEIFTPVHP